jgi:hypothetical protein
VTGVAPVMLNASTGNRITFVSGLAEDAMLCSIWQPVYIANAASTIVGLTFDSVTHWAGPTGWMYGATGMANEIGTSNVFPAVQGVHFIQAAFWTNAAGDTFYGDAAVYGNGLLSQGMQLTIRM